LCSGGGILSPRTMLRPNRLNGGKARRQLAIVTVKEAAAHEQAGDVG
jgi:hypothetical protein